MLLQPKVKQRLEYNDTASNGKLITFQSIIICSKSVMSESLFNYNKRYCAGI